MKYKMRTCPRCRTKNPKGGPQRWNNCSGCNLSVAAQLFYDAAEGIVNSPDEKEAPTDPKDDKPDYGPN